MRSTFVKHAQSGGPRFANGAASALKQSPRKDQQRRRGLVSADAVPFSWIQCAISAFAYVWMLSNFLRTGVAIHDMSAFHALEPNVHMSFGPYAYPVNSFFRNGDDLSNVTSADAVALWSYKYDTTSVAMRTFAEYLNVSAFPPCVLYRGTCADREFLTPATSIAMLDGLVDAVRDRAMALASAPSSLETQDPKYHQRYPQKLLLRASYEYFDRIHHYLMPQVFTSIYFRTCEAVYYSPELLSTVSSDEDNNSSDGNVTSRVDVCSHRYGGVRPNFCDELWTHYTRSCPKTDTECLAVGRVSIHTMRRLDDFQRAYPNATVDLLLVHSSNDISINRGGLTFDGKRGFDVVTLFRARSCSDGGVCTTQALEDYRYEGETLTTDILSWYTIVATLRGAAQSYYWLRMAMLFGGCYYAVARAETNPDSGGGAHRTSFFRRVRRATVMLFKIPSQVIIYGSAFPLVGYVLAHMVDSPVVYEIMGQKFDSFNGLLQLSIMELITVSSLQMRNVWVLAIAVHVVVRFSTHRRWSPTQGVWGMPQFAIALISSLTILSQFRFLSLRWTPVQTVQHVEVTSRLHPTIEALFHVNGGGGKASLGGVFLDAKAIMCSVVILGLLITTLSALVNRALKRVRIEFAFLRARTTVPLTAGVLWPTTALAVAWKDDLFHFYHVSDFTLNQLQPYSTKIQPTTPQPKAATVKHETLDDRSEAEEAAMYLMNITMLSDPLAFLLWRWRSSNTFIGYYRSSETQQVYRIPLIYVSHRSELDWEGFTLERVVAADELTWSEIITCG